MTAGKSSISPQPFGARGSEGLIFLQFLRHFFDKFFLHQ